MIIGDFCKWAGKRIIINPKKLNMEEKYIGRALVWYSEHWKHIKRKIEYCESGYPPTLREDIKNPNLWKPEHWKWFLNKYIY